MNKLLAVLLACFVLVTPGCNSAWWQNFRNDPVQQVEVTISWAHTTLSVATVTFNAIVSELPADKAVVARQEFDKAVLAVNHSLAALQDAVRVAAEVQDAHPDFSLIVSSLLDAVKEIQAVIDTYSVHAAERAGGAVSSKLPVGYTELQVHINGLKRSVGK